MGRAAGKRRVNLSLLEEVRWVQENYDNATSSVDQIVDLLRANFEKYNRQKLPTLKRMVKQTLDSNNKGKQKFTRKYDDDDGSTSSCVRKKAKKSDDREQIELQSDYSSAESPSDDGDEDRRAILTSEDDVSDLTKLMLRNKYSSGVEFEVVTNSNNKETKAVDSVKGANKAQKVNKLLNIGVVDDGPRFKDIGGMDAVLNELLKGVIIPLYHPELPGAYGVRPTGGILLHGPPGCGKTTLAHAIANELGFPFYKISATELVSGISGASEENIRELFSKAYRTAPSVVFIDEIDSIASKRENSQREMERRIVTQLMTCMDQSHRVSKPDDTSKNLETSNNKPGNVLVIGATNRPDALDSALRRPGRFDREIALGVPDENILKVLTRHLTLEGDFDLMKISRMTPGFVAADLQEVGRVAGHLAMEKTINERELELSKESEKNEGWWRPAWWTDEELKKRGITMLDFERAVKRVQASSKREGFSSIPNVKWEDVGGLDSLRREFDLHIVRRIKYQDEYERSGIDLDTGFLLYGPPGCGKTLIAKAVANEAGASFIHIKGPELLNKYVGESESEVRKIFSRARTCSPFILFFDEIDVMTTNRGKEGGSVVQGLLKQLLVELDGADQRKGVYVIGASNRPDVMDQALLRPGRMGKLLYVPLPNQDERVAILKALARNKQLDADVDLIAIAQKCANFSGADLANLMYEAAMAKLEERFNKIAKATDEPQSSLDSLPRTIKAIHFEQALEKVSPSNSDKEIEFYHQLSKSYRAT